MLVGLNDLRARVCSVEPDCNVWYRLDSGLVMSLLISMALWMAFWIQRVEILLVLDLADFVILFV